MITPESIDYTNKVILEIGTGRGGTTFEILPILEENPSANLILTDIVPIDLGSVLESTNISLDRIKTIQTDAIELKSIPPKSIDVIFCYYSLCAINSSPGKATLALAKCWEVLKPNGVLFIEEEYPINANSNKFQKLWADKWKIIKIAQMIQDLPFFNEIEPSILIQILIRLSFSNIHYEEGRNILHSSELLPLFEAQISNTVSQMKEKNLKTALKKWSRKLQKEIQKSQNVEIPIYHLSAQKMI